MDTFNRLLGLEAQPTDLTWVQISLRSVIVFVAALIMVRLGDRRFLSKKTAFDAVLGLVLASMLARAINGNVSFFPTLAGGFVLIGLHKLLAMGSRRSHWFGKLIKGQPVRVVENGMVNAQALARQDFSKHDLMEDLRMNGNVGEVAEVKEANIERNGHISVVKRETPGRG